MTESKAARAARLAKKQELEDKIPAPDFMTPPSEEPAEGGPEQPETVMQSAPFHMVKNCQRAVINSSCGCIEPGETGEITAAEYAVMSKFVEKV